MRIGTIYTLYGRRAGAELLFEQSLESLSRAHPEWEWVVFCNREAATVLNKRLPFVHPRYVSSLDNQFRKALWLEFASQTQIHSAHLNVFWTPSGANSFPGRWACPCLVTFLDLGEYFVKNKYDIKRTVYRKFVCVPRSIRRATAFTAISHRTAKDLKTLFPHIPTASVVYPGASPRPPRLIENPHALIQRETGLSIHGQVLFSPARTDYRGKGRDVLLRAYADYVRTTANPLPLIMPGPPGEHHHLMLRDIRKLRLRDHAFWPGRISDACMDAFYAVSAAMIMPSRYEGFGFPLLEAMSRRVPIICSDAGSLPEIADSAALFFPSGQADELLACIRQLLRDPILSKQLIQRGERQVSRFTWDRYAVNMTDILIDLTEGGECK